MPFLATGDTRLFYRLEGNDNLPVLVLSHPIGTDHAIWAQQMPDLLRHFRVLRYDMRGHGASDAPSGEYSMEQLGRDVLNLADALRISQFAFCGLSAGGMIGQWLGASAPHRLTSLILANTSPLVPPKSRWEDLRRIVLERGMAAIAEMSMGLFFSPENLGNGNPYVNSVRATLLGTNPTGYAGCFAAVRDMDHVDLLREITVPTLIIAGDRDVSLPWTGHGEILARGIPGAKVVHLPAGHLSNIERPRSFTSALFDFLLPKVHDESDPLEAGFAVRRAVLGNAHVDRSIATTNEFAMDFQRLITRYTWGTVWTRPGMDRGTRRLLVLAITAALNRWEEFRLHVRTGLEHELELCDLKETLMQTAMYAGIPAANSAFRFAVEEINAIRDAAR